MITRNVIYLLPRAEVGQFAIRALTAIGINSLNDLARFSEWEIIAIPGMNPETFGTLKRALTAAGLSFAGLSQSTSVR
jgi:hypothetical protein